MTQMLDQNKLVQAVAHVLRQRGGSYNRYALVKILYLAERDHLVQSGAPMCGDIPYAMPFGPALSYTVSFANGSKPSQLWSQCFDRTDNTLRITNDPGDDDLSFLAMDLLDKHLAGIEAHGDPHGYATSNSPEFKSPGSSSREIDYAEILTHHGYSQDEADATIYELRAIQENAI